MSTQLPRGRFAAMRRIERVAELVVQDILTPDRHTRFFGRTDQTRLRRVVKVVVEFEDMRSRARRVRSDRNRRHMRDGQRDAIGGVVADFDILRVICEMGSGVRLRAMSPSDLAVGDLAEEHGRVFRRLAARVAAPEDRLQALLELMRIELLWYGLVW